MKQVENEAANGQHYIVSQAGINNRNQFFHLMLQAHVGIALFTGSELVISFANDTVLQIWGKGREVIGKELLSALPEIEGTPYPEMLRDVYQNGVTHFARENSASLIRNGRPEQVYFNFVYQPFYEPDGNISGVLVIANEVTDQVEARKKAEISEERYRNLVQEALVATAIYTGPDMRIQWANPAMLRLWGKDQSVIGKPIPEALPELEGQPFFPLLQQVYRSGHTYSATEDRAELLVDEKLQTYYFNFFYKPLYDHNGHIYAILNMAVDVTEQVLVKQRLQEKEERLQIALEVAGLGTWDFLPETGAFLMDRRSCEMHGLASGGPISLEALSSHLSPADFERIKTGLERALQPGSGGIFDEEYQVCRDSSASCFVRSKGKTLFDSEGHPYRITGTLLDISEHKEQAGILEQKIRERTLQLSTANAHLERSNQELEQFAHVVSHDLKEPIRKIKFYANRTAEEFAEALPEKARDFLEKVQHSASRMAGMVEGVLKYSTLNARHHEWEELDLSEIIHTIQEDLELPIRKNNATIEVSGLPRLEGARVLVYQLFYNLVNNSLKFSVAGRPPLISISGRPATEAELSHLPAKKADTPYVTIEVRDNGAGFDAKHTGKLFKAFARLHSRDQYEGTGLGLALCKRIVDRHHGLMKAEGREGAGATFTITLPCKQPEHHLSLKYADSGNA